MTIYKEKQEEKKRGSLYSSLTSEHLELPERGPENLLCTEEEVICLLQSIDVLKQDSRTKFLVGC